MQRKYRSLNERRKDRKTKGQKDKRTERKKYFNPKRQLDRKETTERY